MPYRSKHHSHIRFDCENHQSHKKLATLPKKNKQASCITHNGANDEIVFNHNAKHLPIAPIGLTSHR